MEKLYSIKDVAEHFDLPISTIRYYDKKGLLPFVSKNQAGYRVFSKSDFGFIQTICCLKNTGMPIEKIRDYIQLCMQGTSTIKQRKYLLQEHKQNVLDQQRILNESLKEINTKLDRYSSDDAFDIISTQIKYVKTEKRTLNLNDPFLIK